MRALAVGCLLALAGCAERFAVTDGLLARVGFDYDQDILRVHPSRRVVVFPRAWKRVVIGRNYAGAIVDEHADIASRRLFVTFDPDCDRPDCAYVFVRSADGRYRFVEPPKGTRATRRSSDAILEVKKYRVIRG